MTLEEIEQSLKASAMGPDGEFYEYLHTRFGPGYIEFPTLLLIDTWGEVYRTIRLIQMGIEDPKDHPSAAFLLMLFEEMYYHGYTPKEKNR